MCRLLCVNGTSRFAIAPHLETFARLTRESREYQGHGWGCAWRADGEWRFYHNVRPIWEDEQRDFGETHLMLAHARSAFRDEGISVENNMPFSDGELVFVFNGELQGVRIKETGRIGAEKIFNYARRFDRGDMLAALTKAVGVIERRTRYVRAMNLIMADAERVYLCSTFGEDPAYFQMHARRSASTHLICSEPYPGESGWEPIDNHTLEAFPVLGVDSCAE